MNEPLQRPEDFEGHNQLLTNSGRNQSTPLKLSAALTRPRRARRYILRCIRPLFAPILHRIQLRMQTAVEQSAVASGLRDTGIKLDSVLAQIEAQVALGQSSVALGLRDTGHKLDSALSQISQLQSSLKEFIDGFGISQQLLKDIPARLSMLQISADALRLDQNEAQKIGSDKLDQQRFLLDANHVVQGENLQLSALLMSRVDYLLQRVTIPLGRDIVVRTPEGLLLLPADDPVLVTAVWESGGRLEPGTIKVLTALLREGDHTIDVGASVGLTVLPAARQVGPTGRVIALEPGSRAGGLLRQSLALNFLSERVIFYPYAAGEASGTAYLNLGQVLGHSSLLALPGSEGGEDVEVRTVDSLVQQGQRIRLAKLDAEGFEPQVWRGMQRVIAENPGLAVLVEFGPGHLRRAGISVESWLAEFRAPGFTAYEVDEVTGNLRPLRPLPELASVHSLNLLLLRQPPMAFPDLRFE